MKTNIRYKCELNVKLNVNYTPAHVFNNIKHMLLISQSSVKLICQTQSTQLSDEKSFPN